MTCVDSVTIEVIDGVCVDVVEIVATPISVIEIIADPVTVIEIVSCDALWTPDGMGGLMFPGTVSIGGDLYARGVEINPWVRLTAAEYAALPTKDPDTLYVIVG